MSGGKVLFVFDLDNTIVDASPRFAEAGTEPSRDNKVIYVNWVERVQDKERLLKDREIPGMWELVTALDDAEMGERIYLTSREEQWREVTRTWLENRSFPHWDLIMRPNDNYDSTGLFKEKLIKVAMASYGCNVAVVVDDDTRGDLQEACERNGWVFLKALYNSSKGTK